MKNTTETSALSLLANDAGYDPLEDRLRENMIQCPSSRFSR